MFTTRFSPAAEGGAHAANARRSTSSLLLFLVLAAAPIWLAASLRPDAFYVGDSGVKLIAARAALADPRHPLDIPLPDLAGMPATYVEPFFKVHGDHAHAITSPFLPVLTAPLLAAVGLRGLYVLPYLSLVVIALMSARVSRASGLTQAGPVVASIAILGTPFLFYGLEFWEHLPAVAAAACGAALFFNDRGVAAGLLMGVAILLRPEAACFAVALGLVTVAVDRPSRWRRVVSGTGGLLLVLVPYELYVWRHFGSLIPPHIGTNAAAAAGQGWTSLRLEFATAWFASIGKNSFWLTSPVAVVATAASLWAPSRYRAMATLAGVTILLTLLTMPNAGGGQWGPRYLLLASVPFTVIAADALIGLPPRRRAALAVAGAVACFWLQRAAFRELRGTKGTYGAMIDFTREAADARPVVTDVWWLDQVAASVFGERPALFASQEATGRDIVQLFSNATVPAITVIRPGAITTPDVAWLGNSCYFEERRAASPGGELLMIQLRHRCRQ